MTEVQELGTPQGGVGEGVGQNPTPQPTPQEEGNRQPKTEKPSVNLDDLPEFRQVKSKYDSTISKTQKELEQLRQERLQQQQQMDWLNSQLEQLQTKDLDEPGKLAFELQKRDRQIQALNNMLRQQQMSQAKNQALLAIQQRARDRGVNVSYEDLAGFEGADDAWDYILEQAVKMAPQRQQERQEKAEANAPFLGGGGGGGTKDELQSKYDRALKQFDSTAMLRVLDEAARAGVDLTL